MSNKEMIKKRNIRNEAFQDIREMCARRFRRQSYKIFFANKRVIIVKLIDGVLLLLDKLPYCHDLY